MLFGSVTLGAIWWINFAGLIASSTRLENVIRFSEIVAGDAVLGIIGLLSMAIDINLLSSRSCKTPYQESGFTDSDCRQ